tara:strand:- start:279 stop:704 length:426 start_codon:yes stop_codon:yes gene_type:complete
MKMIDIRWVKNGKTKKSSLKLVDRVPYNDYPNGTATAELVKVTEKTPEVKVHFCFPNKKGKRCIWDWQNQKSLWENTDWSCYCLVSMIFNKIENDYDYYFNFYNGKCHARINDQELSEMVSTINVIKSDLKNLLTVNNFSK